MTLADEKYIILNLLTMKKFDDRFLVRHMFDAVDASLCVSAGDLEFATEISDRQMTVSSDGCSAVISACEPKFGNGVIVEFSIAGVTANERYVLTTNEPYALSAHVAKVLKSCSGVAERLSVVKSVVDAEGAEKESIGWHIDGSAWCVFYKGARRVAIVVAKMASFNDVARSIKEALDSGVSASTTVANVGGAHIDISWEPKEEDAQ